MSSPDAIPSGGDAVVVPDYLREILRQTAERKLREACDLAFPPDQRDEVIEAVHLVDAFTHERVTADVILALIPLAIVWKQSEAVPAPSVEAVGRNERTLSTIRELVEFRDRLGFEPPSSDEPDESEGRR
jgi:hypothetical protein